MHWCSLKSDCTIKFSIPKLYENTPFHNSNDTHGGRNNYQKNQGNPLNDTEQVKVEEHTLVLIKKDYANKFSTSKLFENTLVHNSNDTHGGRNNYQISLRFMKTQGIPLNDTEQVKFDEHTLVPIKNRLHQYILHTKIV